MMYYDVMIIQLYFNYGPQSNIMGTATTQG